MKALRKYSLCLNLVNRMSDALKHSDKTRPFTVVVEGNIGSGKTTLLEYFNRYKSVSVFSEPVELWRNCNGHNLLQYVFDDTEKWGFTFESYVLQTLVDLHTKPTDTPVKLMERSIHSARYCFIEKMKRDGTLPAPSAVVLDEWFKWLCKNTSVKVDLIVYLRTSPEVAYKRVCQRNRREEKCVPLDFLKDLHEYHEDWLYRKKSFECPVPVITLNADLDKGVIKEEYERCKSMILCKISGDVCL